MLHNSLLSLQWIEMAHYCVQNITYLIPLKKSINHNKDWNILLKHILKETINYHDCFVLTNGDQFVLNVDFIENYFSWLIFSMQLVLFLLGNSMTLHYQYYYKNAYTCSLETKSQPNFFTRQTQPSQIQQTNVLRLDWVKKADFNEAVSKFWFAYQTDRIMHVKCSQLQGS